ncbi:hypothetical protein CKM354_000667200 [Cercospora kikuchii]|uniref:Uncharacterized protein n=1 Tax=Cercospora kikuchii TaxID=84275 RepID=A0A9P3CIF2_9PEZI|nr:uncharacterized protein CKM354_000667200 [Cercospora kikuchii]GIZ43444.1 hypothetical protein CKM354_000667200 [Cercospora kikuchii]
MSLFPGVALVTGAASGIGQATAISFVREGCRKLVIADLNATGLEETARLMQDLVDANTLSLIIKPLDISQEAEIDTLFKTVERDFGRIDYAANCAGVLSQPQTSHETSAADFDKINGINYRGCWLTSRAEIRMMLRQEPLPSHDGRPGNRGSIVNIASQLGIVGRPAARKYCASKAAVISMTRCDAIDYAKENIRVNCVCPGIIETPMTRPQMETYSAAIAIAPMNRPGTAQEVADAVLFLCSSKATFVQGSAMVVDGGYTIN